MVKEGCPGGSVVEHLPSAQVVIPGSWDGVPHRAPRVEPASPSACVCLPLSVSHKQTNKQTNKIFKKKATRDMRKNGLSMECQ